MLTTTDTRFNPDEVEYDEARFKAYWAAAPAEERKRYSNDEGSFLAYFRHAIHKSGTSGFSVET